MPTCLIKALNAQKLHFRSLYFSQGMDTQVEDAIPKWDVCSAHDKIATPKFASLTPIPLPDDLG